MNFASFFTTNLASWSISKTEVSQILKSVLTQKQVPQFMVEVILSLIPEQLNTEKLLKFLKTCLAIKQQPEKIFKFLPKDLSKKSLDQWSSNLSEDQRNKISGAMQDFLKLLSEQKILSQINKQILKETENLDKQTPQN